MAFIPVPNVAEVAMVYTTPSGQAINTLYFEAPSEYNVAEMVTLAEEIYEWWGIQIYPLQSASVQLSEIRVTDLTFQDAPGIVWNEELPAAGQIVGSPLLPMNVTMTVTFTTLLRGRAYRGRNYVIGLTEGQVTGDNVADSIRNAYVAAYLDLMNITTITYGTFSVVSRYLNGSPRASGVATEVTGAKSDGVVDSQRRRLKGRGA